MTTTAAQRWYTIKDAAALTGLPASTLRYYEAIDVIAPVSRGATSGHRLYGDADLDQIMWVACLAATGMSIADMRRYVANGHLGPEAAGEQMGLLEQQARHLESEAAHLELRQRYVALKIDYWRAVQAEDQDTADRIGRSARTLADELRARTPKES